MASGDSLLTIKFGVPPIRTPLALRPRLTDRLRSAVQGKLTLVAAPAGYGKTTLLTQWHATRVGQELPLAWVSLDSGDNDPVRFWHYVVMALEALHPGVGTSALALLQSPRPPAIEAVLTPLLNSLGTLSGNTVLVLDDYHLIETQTIHHTVSFLLAHLPPTVHLILSTRDDPPFPLARLRARGELVELRAADLRFAPEEGAAFLNEAMGLELSEEAAQVLEERTEGWIAGLQLAAIALRNRDDAAGFIAAFAGSNRYVADYLIEEVLLQQPEVVQAFLLRTCVLDRMCAPLCDALMQWDGGSQEVLEQLERANLFVVALDDSGQWLRYHHLFGDMLRHRLHHADMRRVPELHGSASVWFEEEGLFADAVAHALAVPDVERAGSLIEQHGLSVMVRGQVHTVLSWIDALPDELIRGRAGLCTTHAVALMFIGHIDASEARLVDAERCVQAGVPGDVAQTVLGTVALVRANIAQFDGDAVRFIDLSREAYNLLPEREAMRRSVARGGVACAYLVSGDVSDTSERLLTAALEASRASGDLMASVTGLMHLARLRVMQGRLRRAAATYQEAPRVSPGSGDLHALVESAAYYFGLGDLLREWNDLDAAERYLSQGFDLVQGAMQVNAGHVALGYIARARLYHARGEYDGAIATLSDFARLAEERNFIAPLRSRAAAMVARLELARGDLAAAGRWPEASGLSAGDELGFAREAELLTLARVFIAQGRTDTGQGGQKPVLHDALCLLDRLRLDAETGARTGSIIEIQTLRALALQVCGNTDQAVEALEQALLLAEPEGYVRTFVDEGPPMAEMLSMILEEQAHSGPPERRKRVLRAYVQQLLAAFNRPGPISADQAPEDDVSGPVRPPLDPLIARELEVLRLVTAGRSNREIAAELYLAVNTVKWYLKSLYSKLDVDSRTQAVARARSLQLISD